MRPASLAEPQGPQERVQLRTVEHIADACRSSIFQCRRVDQLLEVCRHLDFHIPKQVIEVPKISASSCRSRKVLVAPQKAEQLVEVPTIVSFSSLQQRTVEQIIDIPVPSRGGGGGGRGGLQDLRPGQDSTAFFGAGHVDIPVPRGQGFLPGQGSTAFFGADQPVVEYIAPAPAVFQSPVLVGQYISPAPAVFCLSEPVVEFFAPAPVAFCRRTWCSHFRVQRRFAEMEVLKTLSQVRVHQRLGEQIIRRSEALLEASRRFWAQVEEEEAEEEETEERDFEEEPLHFRRTRTTSSTRMFKDNGNGWFL